MGHAVQTPHSFPYSVRRLKASWLAKNPGVGAVHVNLSVTYACKCCKLLNADFLADIVRESLDYVTQFGCKGLCQFPVDVGYHNSLCALFRVALCQGRLQYRWPLQL